MLRQALVPVAILQFLCPVTEGRVAVLDQTPLSSLPTRAHQETRLDVDREVQNGQLSCCFLSKDGVKNGPETSKLCWDVTFARYRRFGISGHELPTRGGAAGVLRCRGSPQFSNHT